jgi:ABC-type transport system substrate-binding protein
MPGITERINEHDFQLAMHGQMYVPTDDPTFHYRTGYYHSGSLIHLYSTPELDEKIDRLFFSLDEQERLNLHKELQRDITAQVPVIMMFHRNSVILADEKLADFQLASGTWQIYKGLEKAYVR